jgi:hypothetical protein
MCGLLRRKYGEQVFQISLHGSWVGDASFAKLVGRIAADGGCRPVGFDVPSLWLAGQSSPATPDDGESRTDFPDALSGYIYLGPLSKQERCRWHSGFISPEMFARDKPYFEAECGHALGTAEEADAAMAAFMQRLGH